MPPCNAKLFHYPGKKFRSSVEGDHAPVADLENLRSYARHRKMAYLPSVRNGTKKSRCVLQDRKHCPAHQRLQTHLRCEAAHHHEHLFWSKPYSSTTVN